jgi:two-component system, sensor histidine kinase
VRQSSSLQWKLTGIVAVGSVLTGVLAAAGFSWWDLNRSGDRMGAEVAAVANIVGDQVGPAVVLGDTKAAGEILNSLRTDNRIRNAVLYDGRGTCFVAFHRHPSKTCPPRRPDGISRDADALVITRPVTVGEDRVGTMLLEANAPSLGAVLQDHVQGAGLIVIFSLLVAALLAVVLQVRVTGPILAIASVAERMARTHRFGERVRATDEIGVLGNSFNTMLDEIERRDAELAQQREQLEQEVAKRIRINEALRQAKEKAEEAARLKSEFLANMSHEIRTPLNGVTGMITLALDKSLDPEAREQLDIAQNAAFSLTTILNDILDLSKIEAGKMLIESVRFDFQNVLRECMQIFDIRAREKNLRLELIIAPDCPVWVLGDPVRLRQVLMNLLGNAVKFTPAGEVQLRVINQEWQQRFEFHDTGIGIPREKLDAIFEPFTQADGSHTRRFGGSGLGLTITRRLVKLMGGRLWAESRPGTGSTFYVELPLIASSPATQATGTETSSPTESLPPLHVLVAEDNVVNQKVACGLLKRQGSTVVLAVNGEEAFGCFLRDRFDLILMDVQMPQVDGLEAAAMIRNEEQRRTLPRTPIIAVTAHASLVQHDQCIAHGMDAVVTKPVDRATLLLAIRTVLASNVAADSGAASQIPQLSP